MHNYDYTDYSTYRQHEAQASKTIEKMSQGALELIDSVHEKLNAGRKRHRFIKYAYLGGIVMEWSNKALSSRKYGIALD
jgi:hypothetical protein